LEPSKKRSFVYRRAPERKVPRRYFLTSELNTATAVNISEVRCGHHVGITDDRKYEG